MLQKTISDDWRLNLFQRYLQEKEADGILEFYLQCHAFQERVKLVEDLNPESSSYLDERNNLREFGREICTRYASYTKLSKHVKH